MTIGLLYTVSIMLKYIPSIPSLFLACIIKKCWTFVKTLFWTYCDDHMIFVLNPFDMKDYSCGLVYFELSLHLWNLSSSWWVLVLISFWVLFASISLRIFATVFIVSIKLSFSLLKLPYLCVDFVWQCSLLTYFTEDTSTSGALLCGQSGEFNSESTWAWTYFSWKIFDV